MFTVLTICISMNFLKTSRIIILVKLTFQKHSVGKESIKFKDIRKTKSTFTELRG